MKRPLFWVCTALVIMAMLNLLICGTAEWPARYRQAYSKDPPWDGEKVILSGRVCEKGFQGDLEYFLLTDLSFDQNAATSRQINSILQQMKTDKLQCFLALESGGALPKIGSRICAEGEFSLFETATNPGEFDYAQYYQGKRIGGKLSEVCVLWQGDRHSFMREEMHKMRTCLLRRLDQVFPKKEAGVMRAMLLGDRASLDPELRELYQEGGIIHILSISGLHVTLLGMGLFSLLRRIGMRVEIAAVLACCILFPYGIMTGMGVSASRAIGMFCLRMLALLLGRTYDMPTAMAVIACGMLCLVPTSGLNSGFWLSFGSILGVAVVLPVLESFGRVESGTRILKGIQAGLSILLTTLPLTLWFYYEIPTYATLLNLLVIPLMGPVLVFGMIAMLIPGLGILGTIDVLCLRFFEKLCLWTRDLPFSSWNPGCPKVWQIAVYYVTLSAVLVFLWVKNKKAQDIFQKKSDSRLDETVRGAKKHKNLQEFIGKESGMRLITYFLVVAPILILAFPARRMTGITFLDVGQGDCVFIRSENGQNWICDCGSVSRKDIGDRVLIPFMKHEGVCRVDGIFVTHNDMDHVSGILELLQKAQREGITIKRLYLPVREHEAENFSEVQRAAEKVPNLKLQFLSAGNEMECGNICFTVLNPSYGDMGAEENENSLCLLVRLRHRRKSMTALLTGDVQGKGEEALLQELRSLGIREVTLLKCAHHGSKKATSSDFLSWMDAEITVISCGRKNSYGHPHAETLERLNADGSRVYRTDRSGCISIKIMGEDIKILPFCK